MYLVKYMFYIAWHILHVFGKIHVIYCMYLVKYMLCYIWHAIYVYSSTCHGQPPLVQRKSGPSWQVAPRDRERT